MTGGRLYVRIVDWRGHNFCPKRKRLGDAGPSSNDKSEDRLRGGQNRDAHHQEQGKGGHIFLRKGSRGNRILGEGEKKLVDRNGEVVPPLITRGGGEFSLFRGKGTFLGRKLI